MKEDYELLKKYLQNEIDTGNNKTFIFDKDDVIDFKNCNALSYIENMEEEIERLNNIINELERYINEEYIYDELGMKIFDASKLQDKLQELKGEDKE